MFLERSYTTVANTSQKIAATDDGVIYFLSNSSVTRLDLDGTQTVYTSAPITTNITGSELLLGPDGNLWMVNYGRNSIIKMTPVGVFSEYALVSASIPWSLTIGPDGNIWFAAAGGGYIGKCTTGGTITEYAITVGHSASGIIDGGDGLLWVNTYDAGNNLYLKSFDTSGVEQSSVDTGVDSSGGIMYRTPNDIFWIHERSYGTTVFRVTKAGAVLSTSLPITIPAGSFLWDFVQTDYGFLVASRIRTADTGTANYDFAKISDGNDVMELALISSAVPRGVGDFEYGVRNPANGFYYFSSQYAVPQYVIAVEDIGDPRLVSGDKMTEGRK